MLLCRTKPIIEASTNLAFACYNLPYSGLASQLAACNLSPFHNFWSHIFDFTPPESGKPNNWSLLPAGTTAETILGSMPEDVTQLVQAAVGSPDEHAVYETMGDNREQSNQKAEGDASMRSLILFAAASRSKAHDFVQQQVVACKDKQQLLHTNEAVVSQELMKQMCGSAGWGSADVKQFQGSMSVVVEVSSAQPGDRDTLWKGAQELGALVTADQETAQAFRYLGVDG